MKTLTFTAEDKGDGRVISKMEPSEFTVFEIIGILTNQAILLATQSRTQSSIQKGSSAGSTH